MDSILEMGSKSQDFCRYPDTEDTSGVGVTFAARKVSSECTSTCVTMILTKRWENTNLSDDKTLLGI